MAASGYLVESRFGAQVHIERAHADNPDEAIALIEEYYRAVDVVARDDRAAMLRYLSEPDSAIWVAYAESEPIGCILFHRLRDLNAAGEVKRLFVRDAYRGQGVARLLLEAVEQFAKDQKIEWLYLDTKDDLMVAIGFYKRHGYRSCERYNDNPQATVFMRKYLPQPVLIRHFQMGDEEAFRTLNEAWIEEYFRLEEKDRATLNNPHKHVLVDGGQIFMAIAKGEAIGCCALLSIGEREWEIAKMGVRKNERGRGIGRQLLEYAIHYAKSQGSKRLYIETNSSLLNAIHLYESVGFRPVPTERITPSPYARADVYLEMFLH